MNKLGYILVVLFVAWAAQPGPGSEANAQGSFQGHEDVKPYEFAQIAEPGFSTGSVHVYKTVHQGCELFIAIDSNGDTNHGHPLAMTAGRGCN